MEQQREAGSLGMWAFLLTEIMFFGGLFVCYAVYHALYPAAFAEASRQLNVILGATNTGILICSSLTMVLAVQNAQQGKRKPTMVFLALTMILGSAFLGIKAFEYAHKFHEHLFPGTAFAFEGAAHPQEAQIFFSLYFVMTGLHALHMIIGIGLLGVLLAKTGRGRFSEEYYAPVDIAGLYWHFVDIVWIFLFPLLYLISRA
jgi:cytochrome c oxidase subunit 3